MDSAVIVENCSLATFRKRRKNDNDEKLQRRIEHSQANNGYKMKTIDQIRKHVHKQFGFASLKEDLILLHSRVAELSEPISGGYFSLVCAILNVSSVILDFCAYYRGL